MSQSKVSDFFSCKKGSSTFQPSKRRKLGSSIQAGSTNEIHTLASPPLASRTRSRKTAVQIQSKSSDQISIAKKAKVSTRKKKLVCNDPLQSKLPNVLPKNNEEEITAVYDDHNASPPCSPSKKKKCEPEDTIQSKRIRHPKPSDLLSALQDCAKTPDRKFDFTKYAEKEAVSARKKLVLKSPSTSDSSNKEQRVSK